MSVLQRLGLTPRPGLLAPSAISSPWTDGALQSIVWSEVFGADVPQPLSRVDAMTVPAMSKARNLLCTTAAKLPLVVLDVDGPLSDTQQPGWAYRTDGSVSPHQRIIWTVDDLLFYGQSLWSVTRGSEGHILTAERLPYEWWSVSAEGSILVNDQPVNARDVIYFASHTDALLTVGKTAIDAARSTGKSVERRAATPVPVMEIHQSDAEASLTETEAKKLVADYNKARRDPEGATVFTPSHIELKPHGERSDSGALVEARNASRLDIANHTGVPASMLEGSSATASLTYVTTDGKRSEFLEYGVQPWLDTIQWRLSMDDVVPRGQRVRFNLDELLTIHPSATGAEVKD